MNRILFHFILLSLAAGQGMTLAATQTNAAPTALDFNSFKIISERNIFNQSRSGKKPRTTSTRPRQPKIETFTLRGTLAYEKGQHAIFDAGSREKDLKLGDLINGFMISQIAFDHVVLTPGKGKPVVLTVGKQMRREDDGPWTLSSGLEPVPVTVSSADVSLPGKAATEGAASGSEDDIVRKLMEKRMQKLKK